MKPNFTKTALIGLFFALIAPAFAVSLTINNGLGGAAGGLVGTVDPGSPASLANEVVYINNLLGLNANATATISSHNYATTAYNFNGTVTSVNALDYPDNPPSSGPAGFQYVLGKFGNLDYVWYVGGQSFDIPSTLTGGGLSHWAAFNPTGGNGTTVPDSGTTVALLGLALGAIALIRRKLS